MAAKSFAQNQSKYNTEELNTLNNTYESVMNNKDCVKIIKLLRGKYSKYIEPDEIISLSNIGVMNACRKYDMRVKFTTFLYQQISFLFRSYLYKQKNKYYKHKQYMETAYNTSAFDKYKNVYEGIIELLKPQDRAFIEDKFIGNLSTNQMATKYNCSPDEIRARYNKIIRFIKIEYGVSLTRNKEKQTIQEV